jgi:site-specific DNA recombinase
VRVSTEEQQREGVSLPAQRARIAAYCESRNWELVKTYSDTASGKDLRRPGVRQMLEDMHRGAFEVLVFMKVDRLTRRLLDFAQVQQEFHQRGIGLASISEGFDDTTPIGRAMGALVAVFAELERETIRERTRTALAYKRERGEVYSRFAPFGYRKRADHLLPDPKALETVRSIFSMRKGGATLRAIAASLTEQHIRSPQGQPTWSPETVRLILLNAAVYGEVLNGLLK